MSASLRTDLLGRLQPRSRSRPHPALAARPRAEGGVGACTPQLARKKPQLVRGSHVWLLALTSSPELAGWLGPFSFAKP